MPDVETMSRAAARLMARQDAAAIAMLVIEGVQLDPTPAEPHTPFSCEGCQWHVFVKGEERDGGSASSIWGWFKQGHFGDEPEEITLRPVRQP